MVTPITTCEHCGTNLKVPVMPGAPESGIMRAGTIECGVCHKMTRVQEALIIADDDAGAMSVPTTCPQCSHCFTIPMGKHIKAAEAGMQQPIDLRCPRCHAQAPPPHGAYEFIEGGLQFRSMDQQLQNVQLESAQVERLIEVFQAALKNPQRSEDKIREALKEHPLFAEIAVRFMPQDAGGTTNWLMVILTWLLVRQGHHSVREAKLKNRREERARREREAAEEKARDAEHRKARRAAVAQREARKARLAREAAEEKAARSARKTWKP
jgi:hypothetical protein